MSLDKCMPKCEKGDDLSEIEKLFLNEALEELCLKYLKLKDKEGKLTLGVYRDFDVLVGTLAMSIVIKLGV